MIQLAATDPLISVLAQKMGHVDPAKLAAHLARFGQTVVEDEPVDKPSVIYDDAVYRTKEAAAMLRVSTPTLQRLCRTLDIKPPKTPGGHPRWTGKLLKEILERWATG